MRRAAVTLAIVFASHAASAQTAGYKVARQPRMGLVLTGASMLALGWAASAIAAAAENFAGDSPWLLVPLAGPWIGLAAPNQSIATDAGLVAIGLTQATGAILLAVGLVPHEVRSKVTVTPTFGWSHGPSAGICGRF